MPWTKRTKTCPYCQKVFESHVPDQTCCSRQCAKSMFSKNYRHPEQPEHVCPRCQKHFRGRTIQKYCSVFCARRHRVRVPDKERFEKLINKTDSCWPWLGAI